MRHIITKTIAILFYFLGVDSIFYFLNKKAKRIITFHNVLPFGLLPGGKSIGLTDTEESFKKKVRLLKRHFRLNTDVFDENSATITFDDGYKNQYEVAGRILQEEGNIPAILFTSGRVINSNTPKEALVVDLLLHWVWLAPDGEYDLTKTIGICFELTVMNRADIWEFIIWPAFLNDSVNKGRILLKELSNQYSVDKILSGCNDEYLRLRLTGVSENDIKSLKEKGWLVGWHSKEHYPLSMLDNEAKDIEIDSAPEQFKTVVFSYPYGELESVNSDSLMLVKRCGYPCAVSNVYEPNKLFGRFFIPRMMLSDDKYLAHFELSGAKYFLLHRKLLPTKF